MGFDQLTFGNPSALWGLALVALLGVAAVAHHVLTPRRQARLARPHVLATLLAHRSGSRVLVRDLLLLGALAFGVLALARPQYGLRDTEVRNTGIDVIVLLDVSKSMKVSDIVPDRLAASKLEIDALLDRMKGGRVALLPFAGIGFLQSPYTSDFGAVKACLETLDVRDMPIGGTAIGRALDLALKVIEGRPDAAGAPAIDVRPFEGSAHRALVVFTDGENLEGDPLQVAERAKALNVKIYTVGVGTGFGKPVPLLDDEGRQVGIQKEDDGKTPVYSALNEELLTKLAETTGGRYLHYENRSVADELYAEIDKLEKAEYLERVKSLREERFQVALAPAALLLLIRLLLGTRRRERAPRNGGSGNATIGLAVVLLTGLWAPSPARAFELFVTTNADVDRAIELTREGKIQEALGALEAARKELPDSAELHYDVGSVYLALTDFENAEKELQRALETAEGETRDATLYNLGTLHATWADSLAQKDDTRALAKPHWKQAVEYLEKLAIRNPNHRDALQNLELALLSAYPPCSKEDDSFEPNNDASTAKPLPQDQKTGQVKQALRLCPGDSDWFSLPLPEGARVTAKVSVTAPEEGPPPATKPDVNLYEPDGQVPVTGVTRDGETLKAGPVGAAGDYRLGVVNPSDDDALPYDLELSVLPRCESIDDTYEPNDTFEGAKELTAGPHENLRVCPGDEDLYTVALKEGESLVAILDAQAVTGTPMLQIVGADLKPLSGMAAKDGKAMAVAFEPGAGKLYVRVFAGPDGEAAYTLNVAVLPPCPAGNDAGEPNDHPADAKPLEEQKPVFARVCPGDVDLVRYTAQKDQPTVVKALFQHEKGDLALDLLDAAGEKVEASVDASSLEQPGEALPLPKEKGGADVLVRVRGADEKAENVYLLTVDHPQPEPQNGDRKQDQQKQDQQKQDQQKQDQQKQDQQKQDQQKQEQGAQEPMEQQIDKMQRNPRNLEAERALRRSPYRDQAPRKDW